MIRTLPQIPRRFAGMIPTLHITFHKQHVRRKTKSW